MTDTDPLLTSTKSTAASPRSSSSSFAQQGRMFRLVYYVIACIQALSVPLFLVGQTTCIFAYEWTAKHGLQESLAEIGPAMVQVNRAFGAGDTIINIPILFSSAYGLFRKKRWALICTAASAGIQSYWSCTILFIFWFLGRSGVEDWLYNPPVGIWAFVWFYILYGILVLTFLYFHWNKLVVILD